MTYTPTDWKAGPSGGTLVTAARLNKIEQGIVAVEAESARMVDLDVVRFGAVGDGVTDDTAAIQAALNAVTPGQAIKFPATGSGKYYRTTDTLYITTPNVRLVGQPRDAYAMSIRCAVAGKTMLSVKAPGFVLQDVGLIGVEGLGSGATNGAGANVHGIELFGDADGNVDALIVGSTFQYLDVAVRVRGRNAKVGTDTLFNNVRRGVVFDGIDATYHTGPNADQNRGNTVTGARFHNVGSVTTEACIEFTSTAKIIHALVQDNFFDSNGYGKHVLAVGTSANPHQRITCKGNQHTELLSIAYDFTYVYNFAISDATIYGYTAAAWSLDAIKLHQCTNALLSDLMLYQIGRSGIVSTNGNGIVVRDVGMRSLGLDPAQVGSGLSFDSTNTGCRFDHVKVETADGWGFIGSAADSVMTDCEFRAVLLGVIDSTTVLNHASRGANRFVEGRRGRIEDVGFQSYDFAAGVPRTIATVTAGSNFGSFVLEVEVTGRDGVAGPSCFAFLKRYVLPENGAPVITTIGADVVANLAVTIAAAGTTGVTVAVTAANAVYAGVRIRAAAGGAASASASRQVTVGLASAP